MRIVFIVCLFLLVGCSSQITHLPEWMSPQPTNSAPKNCTWRPYINNQKGIGWWYAECKGDQKVTYDIIGNAVVEKNDDGSVRRYAMDFFEGNAFEPVTTLTQQFLEGENTPPPGKCTVRPVDSPKIIPGAWRIEPFDPKNIFLQDGASPCGTWGRLRDAETYFLFPPGAKNRFLYVREGVTRPFFDPLTIRMRPSF
jgi:hypothetical protein